MMAKSKRINLISVLGVLFVCGCSATKPPLLSVGHLQTPPSVVDDIPEPVVVPPALVPPGSVPRLETYSVVVNEVPVKEFLFQLARDAKINVDIDSGIEGVVTLNAFNQTLPQILDRVSRQANLRYRMDGDNLIISPDLPYWKTYSLGYLNMSRSSVGEIGVATQISTAGGSVATEATAKFGNISNTNVVNRSDNNIWSLIEVNIRSMLGLNSSASQEDQDGGGEDAVETEGIVSSGGSDGAEQVETSLLINPMSGMVSVKATQRQHDRVQHFIDQMMANVLRQVLIEMTIVEVELSDRYQAGVDWESIANGEGLSLVNSLLGSNLRLPPLFSLSYNKTSSSNRNISATIKMLEEFGDVKVLSSPKIMALNNQTALLKVVDEKVYFTVEREVTEATTTTNRIETFTSRIHTVPVGMVMSVTPQISADQNVMLNIRPTISRITGFAVDPAPQLANSGFDNLIPELQVREMETLLQVANEQMVVMGGLMQNKVNKNSSGIPFLSSLPWIGPVFSYKKDELVKTELVIFLRPKVIKGAGTGFDISPYKSYIDSVENRQFDHVKDRS